MLKSLNKQFGTQPLLLLVNTLKQDTTHKCLDTTGIQSTTISVSVNVEYVSVTHYTAPLCSVLHISMGASDSLISTLM